MHRKALRWASRSMLLDSLTPRWFAAGRKAKLRNTAHREDNNYQLGLAAQTTDAIKSGTAADSPVNTIAVNEDDDRSTGMVCDAHGQVNNDITLPSLADGFATIDGAGVQRGDFVAHQPFAVDGAAHTASGPGSISVGSGSASGKVVTPESTPSARASVHGSHSFLAFGIGGYHTSPTRTLDWAQGGGMLQHDGQLPGTRLTEGSNYVPTGKGTFGASVSDPLPNRDLSPLSGWHGTTMWTGSTVSNGLLPGRGEIGGASATSQGVNIHSGSATEPVGRQSAATQSLAAAAATTNAIVAENQKQGNPESEWGITGAGSSNIEGFASTQG